MGEIDYSKSAKSKIPMVTISVEDEITILNKSLKRFENKYRMSSAQMLEKVSSGEEEDTPEVMKWMMDYHGLTYIHQTLTDGKRSTDSE